jgi:hypothetical protein
MTSAQHLREYVDTLSAEEQYDTNEGHWTFRSGGSCCCCTDAAKKVANAFGGRVVGYFATDNRPALVGGVHNAGHDFALIADRFIVDYWAFRVVRLITRPVLDLNIREDRNLARHLYGNEDTWEDVPVAIE